jgi:outer membrane protein OmpA-like peptidoglycan-associated protein
MRRDVAAIKTVMFSLGVFLAALVLARPVFCQDEGGLKIGVDVKAEGNVVSAISKYLDKQEKELSQVADAERTDEGVTIKMKSKILFDFDSYDLKESAKVELGKLAQVLLKYPENVIVVEGHTDSTGDEAYNQLLSENRAEAVATFLVSQGISRSAISYVGYGESRPVFSNDTPEGQEQNRRVEIDITVDEKKFVMRHPEEPEKEALCPEPEPQKRYTDKLTMEVDGAIYFSGTFDADDYTFMKFYLSPSVGIFVAKGVVIGIAPGLIYERFDPAGPGNLEVDVSGGALVYVGYVLDIKKVVFPYVQAGIGGFGGQSEEAGVVTRFNAFAVAPEVGLKFVADRNGIFTLGFRYMYQNIGRSGDPTRDNNHSFYLGLGVGVWFDLERKKKQKGDQS